jgi:hypothetical protein
MYSIPCRISLLFLSAAAGTRAARYTLYIGRIKEKSGEWNSMLLFTIPSPYLLVDSEVQLSSPTTTNANKCFPNN